MERGREIQEQPINGRFNHRQQKPIGDKKNRKSHSIGRTEHRAKGINRKYRWPDSLAPFLRQPLTGR
jgi:hypothetical protein